MTWWQIVNDVLTLLKDVRKLKKDMSDAQTAINQGTAQLQHLHGVLSTAVPKITDGFTTLETLLAKAQTVNPDVDLAEFKSALAQVTADAQPLVNIVPANAIPANLAPLAGFPPPADTSSETSTPPVSTPTPLPTAVTPADPVASAPPAE